MFFWLLRDIARCPAKTHRNNGIAGIAISRAERDERHEITHTLINAHTDKCGRKLVSREVCLNVYLLFVLYVSVRACIMSFTGNTVTIYSITGKRIVSNKTYISLIGFQTNIYKYAHFIQNEVTHNLVPS